MSENLAPENLNTDNIPELNSTVSTDSLVDQQNTVDSESTDEQKDEQHIQNDAELNIELEVVEDDLYKLDELDKNQLLDFAQKSTIEQSPEISLKYLKQIKKHLENILDMEYQQALSEFIENGGNKDDFAFKTNDPFKEKISNLIKDSKNKLQEQKQRQELEKASNLVLKLKILDEIKLLSEEEEHEGSLKKLKDLQTQWRSIRNIPKEQIDSLWETYHIYIHQFYDRLSIYNELKDLDRRKNLDHKIELIEKVSQLMNEINSKRALINLKRYQEEWKSIGPVPKEANEEIWNRFRLECDKVYEMIKSIQLENDKIREDNLLLKKELLAKALALSNTSTTKIKEWVSNTQLANELMEEWKKIGMVPLKYRESIWEEFRLARNDFFNNKNNFFKKLQGERTENLKQKTTICEKAENISTHAIEWNKATDEIKKLQEEWKKIGSTHDKLSDVLWKRFRTACDVFFERKASHYSTQVEEQKNNLTIKTDLLNQLGLLLEKEDGTDILIDLKKIQDLWNNTGFVPMSEKDKIAKKYAELNDKVFSKFKEASSAIKDIKEKSHWDVILSSPNGSQKIKREERILIERIKGIQTDIITWDNNLGFFSKGNKGENPMKKQIEDKIEIAQRNIVQLEQKLKTLRQFIKEKGSELKN
jgi:hypothetical protein